MRGASAGLVLRVLLPLGAAFYLSNFYRSVNAILSPYLIADLHLPAERLGLLTSVYFFTSAVFQAPLGLFMDRFGPRKVAGSLMVLATVGVLMFALGSDFRVLVLGRAIMGIGAAGALMTAFQAIVLWFPVQRWPSLNGWVMSAGGLGMLTASLPAQLVLHVTDWHGLMLLVAGASLAVAIAIFLIVPERRAEAPPARLAVQFNGLLAIYRDRMFWRFAPASAATGGFTLAFVGLWSGPWLKDVAGQGSDGIAFYLLCLTSLITLGYVFNGAIAGTLLRRGVTLRQMIAAGALVLIVLQVPLLLPVGSGRWFTMLGIGAFGGINVLSYPALNAHFGAALSGRVNTAMNLFVFCGAFAMQFVIGLVIGLFPQTGPGSYPALAYQAAFALMFVIEIAAWIWLLLPERR